MILKDKLFDKGESVLNNIIRDYKRKEFDKIPKKNLLKFLGAPKNSRALRLMKNDALDMKILKSWENWFQGKGLSTQKNPYVIQESDGILYMWVERKGWAV